MRGLKEKRLTISNLPPGVNRSKALNLVRSKLVWVENIDMGEVLRDIRYLVFWRGTDQPWFRKHLNKMEIGGRQSTSSAQ